MLHIKNLYKKFGTKKVLNNISVSIDHGTIAIFLGASGVGKSTLLRVLSNLETADSGTITLDGVTINQTHDTQNYLAGMVFQQFNLFDHLTVEKNIMLALQLVKKLSKSQAHSIAHNLLKQYGLAEKAHVYPAQLSGGQKQRLAIARTIALEPKIVCFDEPTSALDPMLTTHIANTIQDLASQGYIVAIATHDTALINSLDCMVYLMQNGSIVETASSDELRKNPSRYEKLKSFIAGEIE